MARIPMTSGFTLIPEGTHVFRIYDAKYDETFGKIEIKMINAAGMVHTERFSIKDKSDNLNEQALGAFSHFAKTAMNDYSIEDLDPMELLDHYICAEIVHSTHPSSNDPNKMVTFANITSKSPAEYFDTAPVARALSIGKADNKEPKAEPKPAPVTSATPISQPSKGLDLDALLGN